MPPKREGSGRKVGTENSTKIKLNRVAVKRAFARHGVTIGALAKRAGLPYARCYEALSRALKGDDMQPFRAALVAQILDTSLESLLLDGAKKDEKNS